MPSGRYLVGRYEVDFTARSVSLGGRTLRLHWRGFEALRELVAAGGAPVARDRLFQALWPGAVVDESSLGKVISQLRRALDEGDPGVPHIETLPGAGYRLTVPVRILPVGLVPAPVPRARPWWKWAAAAAAAAFAAAACLAAFVWETPKEREARAAMEAGRQLLRARDPAKVPEAVGLLRRATELNPKSAEAYGTLAHALHKQGGAMALTAGAKSPALLAAVRAVELDPRCGNCNGTLGLMLLMHAWQWDKALYHLEEAIRLSPDDYDIRPSYALALLAKGHRQEALDQIDIALKGAPFHAGYHGIRARTLYMMKRYPEAVEAADRVVAIQPSDPAGWEWRSQALLQMGQAQAGIAAATAMRYPENAANAQKAVRAGGLDAALRLLIEVSGDGNHHRWRVARWKMILRDADGAMEALEAAYGNRHFETMFTAVDPVFEPLHGHPRFERLLSDMELRPAAARQTSKDTPARKTEAGQW
jgi:DNA-binding winged helix-turn-helix (wHTH) protein/tetratricopeptide (TPR) repeat protein